LSCFKPHHSCHTFAAGYDIRTKEGYEKTMSEFDRIVGFHYLKAIHLNDSKAELVCEKKRHCIFLWMDVD
jgi:endonuclease IV